MRIAEKEKLDEIGRALLKADAVPVREIDRIVAKGEMFDAILTRVKSTRDAPARRGFLFRRKSVAFAAVALMAVSALAFVVFRSKPAEVVVTPSPAVPKKVETKRFTEPDRVVDSKLPPAPAQEKAERIVAKPSVSVSRPKPSRVSTGNHEGDFYALSYAGDPNETERGGRIVRVDVPKSTLFAMGVDIPLENEADTVKADLLIGSDGVTRAIRVVK